jgi:Holliday junction resolvasome RuvABC ATP-dependent DNA helicase subunit
VKFEAGLLDEIATVVRGNPRTAVLLSNDIATYCNVNNTPNFTLKDWHKLCHQLDIKKYGLTNGEIHILQLLVQHGNCTLNMLSAMTGESRSALQRDLEYHLLKTGLIKIDGSRQITQAGRTLLATL